MLKGSMLQLNVYGRSLTGCCSQPMTGFYRDGFCHSDTDDHGLHTVCIVASKEFLAMSKYLGNDLSTPRPEYDFAGIKIGDKWCLCASRWVQAYQNDCAPLVDLEATNLRTLEVVSLEVLERFALKPQEGSV